LLGKKNKLKGKIKNRIGEKIRFFLATTFLKNFMSAQTGGSRSAVPKNIENIR
jgi:hypothetical protein